MTKQKRLGRGLDALLSKPVSETNSIIGVGDKEGAQLQSVSVELLQRGKYQPRVDIRKDALESLAHSIKAQGVVQPIVIRKIERSEGEAQRYEIIAGERRWRAAQLAGLYEIPAIVKDLSDRSAVAVSLIENIQRENLNPLEEARALDRLIDEFNLTHKEAASAVGRSRAAVSNLLRLLDLSDEVKQLVEAREIDMGHARALLSIEDHSVQNALAIVVIKKSLSVRQTEQFVRREIGRNKPQSHIDTSTTNKDTEALERNISERLGAKVKITHTAKGKGKLVISYNSLDELDGILEHIK